MPLSDLFNDARIVDCKSDRNGNVWLITTTGLISVNAKDEIRFLNSSSGLPYSNLNCVHEDREGNFWIGSNGKGMFRFPGETFKYFDRSTDYQSDLFLTGFQKKNGDFYFGTLDEGILKKSKNGKVEIVYSDEACIWSSAQDVAGRDWFGRGSCRRR